MSSSPATSSTVHHVICEPCFFEHPDFVEPDKTVSKDETFLELCCYCGSPTDAGLYVLDNPDRMRCKGAHG